MALNERDIAEPEWLEPEPWASKFIDDKARAMGIDIDGSADSLTESRYHLHEGCGHSCIGYACTFTRTMASICVDCQRRFLGL